MTQASAVSAGDLLATLSSLATTRDGGAATVKGDTITGSITAITAKWLLGGRKVTNSFRCTLDPATHEAHFQESTMEMSWGVPPPTFTVETSSQFGSRVNKTRHDTGVGGGGTLEFGRFREEFERAVEDAGWKFVFEVL